MTSAKTYTESQLAGMIHSAGMRPSAQRIAIFSVIANSRIHPSAEEIYIALEERFPTLSRTTVYNSLHSLTECGLVRELEIESNNKRYDLARQREHGHFICRECGKIYDMPLNEKHNIDNMPGFKIESMEIYCKGLCPVCIKKFSNNSK